MFSLVNGFENALLQIIGFPISNTNTVSVKIFKTNFVFKVEKTATLKKKIVLFGSAALVLFNCVLISLYLFFFKFKLKSFTFQREERLTLEHLKTNTVNKKQLGLHLTQKSFGNKAYKPSYCYS